MRKIAAYQGLSPQAAICRFASYGNADEDSFCWITEAWFERVDAHEAARVKASRPSYVSGSGSTYWYMDEGVYRMSDHWGRHVGTCDWFLEGQSPSDSAFAFDDGEAMGFAEWGSFELKNDEARTYDNTLPDGERYRGTHRITFDDVSDGVADVEGEFFMVQRDKVRNEYKLVKNAFLAGYKAAGELSDRFEQQYGHKLRKTTEERLRQEGGTDEVLERYYQETYGDGDASGSDDDDNQAASAVGNMAGNAMKSIWGGIAAAKATKERITSSMSKWLDENHDKWAKRSDIFVAGILSVLGDRDSMQFIDDAIEGKREKREEAIREIKRAKGPSSQDEVDAAMTNSRIWGSLSNDELNLISDACSIIFETANMKGMVDDGRWGVYTSWWELMENLARPNAKEAAGEELGEEISDELWAETRAICIESITWAYLDIFANWNKHTKDNGDTRKESMMRRKMILRASADSPWLAAMCDAAQVECERCGWGRRSVEDAVSDYFWGEPKRYFDMMYDATEGDLSKTDFDEQLPSLVDDVMMEFDERGWGDRFAMRKRADYWVEDEPNGGYAVWSDEFCDPCGEFDDYETAREFAVECSQISDYEGRDGVRDYVQCEIGRRIASRRRKAASTQYLEVSDLMDDGITPIMIYITSDTEIFDGSPVEWEAEFDRCEEDGEPVLGGEVELSGVSGSWKEVADDVNAAIPSDCPGLDLRSFDLQMNEYRALDKAGGLHHKAVGPKKASGRKAQVADIIGYKNDEFGTYLTLEDGGEIDVFETSDCDYAWEYYDASGQLVGSNNRFETEDEAIDDALDALHCSYRESQREKADCQWPLINEFVDRALDIEKSQFRNWQSIEEIRNDDDVLNLAETMRLDDETFAEGCRRVFEEAPLNDRPLAKRSAARRVIARLRSAIGAADRTYKSSDGKTFRYDYDNALLQWVDPDNGMEVIDEYSLSRDGWEENPEYWVEDMSCRIEEELSYLARRSARRVNMRRKANVANFKIYQTDNRDYRFERWDYASSNGFDFGDYDEVWSDTVDMGDGSPYDALNVIYEAFNLSRPSEYEGRSLSTSDIVELSGRLYYIDAFGFKDITDTLI